MLVVREVLPDKAGRDRDGRVGNGSLEVGHGGLLLGFDGDARLRDHLLGFGLRLRRDVGLDGLAGLLGIGHDLRSQGLRVFQLGLVLGQRRARSPPSQASP